jgi:dienelactone hydrolase
MNFRNMFHRPLLASLAIALALAGAAQGGEPPRDMGDRAARALPEWKAALDAVEDLDFVGKGGPVGYWGVSMGTALGVPFVAAEPRITAAVFGLFGVRAGNDKLTAAARSIKIPLQFVFQWDDELVSREAGLALFDAFASAEKSMHINPGGHMGIPDFERDAWTAFYMRHFGPQKARVAA